MLIRPGSSAYRALEPAMFRILLMCDGVTPLSGDLLTAGERTILDQLQAQGVVSAADVPRPIAPQQVYRFHDNRFMQMIMWSLTGRCNFRCRHCFLDSPDSSWQEMTTAEAMRVVDQLAECGVLSVHLTGGEPFVRPDFWQIVDRLCEKGVGISAVYTNAWLVSPSTLDAFDQRGLKPEFSISFDGLGWHDWMRGVPGAEQHTLDVLALCVRRGFPVNAAVTLHRGNSAVLRETLRKLSDLGVPRAKIGEVQPTELWKARHEGNQMTSEEYYETVLRYIPSYYEDKLPIQVHFGNAVMLHPDPEKSRVTAERYPDDPASARLHLCTSARYASYIAPDGRLLPCLPMTACAEQVLFPRIQTIGLKKALTDSFYMDFLDRRVGDLLAANPKCGSCAHRYQCGGGCRASALLSTHRLMGCDRTQCLQYQNNYPERIRQALRRAGRRGQ
ncbi:MAG: radical SAM protein [Clostridia bacterium]|nr:radical SAM protein [Clostridia bacterium]